jgi:hypothetical protein
LWHRDGTQTRKVSLIMATSGQRQLMEVQQALAEAVLEWTERRVQEKMEILSRGGVGGP